MRNASMKELPVNSVKVAASVLRWNQVPSAACNFPQANVSVAACPVVDVHRPISSPIEFPMNLQCGSFFVLFRDSSAGGRWTSGRQLTRWRPTPTKVAGQNQPATGGTEGPSAAAARATRTPSRGGSCRNWVHGKWGWWANINSIASFLFEWKCWNDWRRGCRRIGQRGPAGASATPSAAHRGN